MTPSPAPLRASWILPALILALGLIPAFGSVSRLVTLAAPGLAAPGDDRFLSAPLPIALHAGGALALLLLGALQVWPAFRRRHPLWHRRAGRVLAATGMIFALGGLAMVATYPRQPDGSLALDLLRLVTGSAILILLALGWRAARARDFRRHRTHMLRALALFMGSGTFVPIYVPFVAMGGPEGPVTFVTAMALAFAVNLGIAEIAIRRPTGA